VVDRDVRVLLALPFLIVTAESTGDRTSFTVEQVGGGGVDSCALRLTSAEALQLVRALRRELPSPEALGSPGADALDFVCRLVQRIDASIVLRRFLEGNADGRALLETARSLKARAATVAGGGIPLAPPPPEPPEPHGRRRGP
jgi:hypothetical protein